MSAGSRPMPNGDHCERKKCAAVQVCSWAWTCAHRYCPALGKQRRFVGGETDPSGRFGSERRAGITGTGGDNA